MNLLGNKLVLIAASDSKLGPVTIAKGPGGLPFDIAKLAGDGRIAVADVKAVPAGLYAKAALVDHASLRRAQGANNVVDAELILKHAFFTDVTPAIAAWRKANKLPADPLAEHRRLGYAKAAAADRKRRRQELGITQGGSYA